MSDLDQLLNDYNDKKRREEEESERQRLRENELLQQSLEAFTGVILPVLKEISSGIKAKGFASEVEESIKGILNPSVKLTFNPLGQNSAYSSVATSSLLFMHSISGSGKIEVRAEIKTKDGSPAPSYTHDVSSWEPLDINEDKVRSKVTSFIKSVLDVN